MLIKQNKNKNGFTLTEIIIVAAIIGLIAIIAIPNYMRYRATANETAIEQAMKQIAQALEQLFWAHNPNEYPPESAMPNYLVSWATPTNLGTVNDQVIAQILKLCERVHKRPFAEEQLTECFNDSKHPMVYRTSGGNQSYIFIVSAGDGATASTSTLFATGNGKENVVKINKPISLPSEDDGADTGTPPCEENPPMDLDTSNYDLWIQQEGLDPDDPATRALWIQDWPTWFDPYTLEDAENSTGSDAEWYQNILAWVAGTIAVPPAPALTIPEWWQEWATAYNAGIRPDPPPQPPPGISPLWYNQWYSGYQTWAATHAMPSMNSHPETCLTLSGDEMQENMLGRANGA